MSKIPIFVRLLLPILAVAVPFALLLGVGAVSRSAEKVKAERQLAHMVFFTLKDHSPESREKLSASCYKYLASIEGVVYFSVGTGADDVDEPGVSVHDFDVALHAVFESKDAKDKYLKHKNHVQFVGENKATFVKVRVFDSYLKKP
jgi:hypothetical protein